MMTCPFDDVFNTSEGHIFNAMNCVFVGIEKMKIYIYIYIKEEEDRRRRQSLHGKMREAIRGIKA
jgi:hypothetical protein